MDASLKLKKINGISPSFCAAKWLQVTIDLIHGTTHSCHHPQRHLIPLEEIQKDVSALHNTEFKKMQRKLMLDGVRPPECSYCWDMEDLGNQYSDRYIKSTDPWAWPYLDEIKNMPAEKNISPTYLEVMIDNVCNFSCAYCMSDISTSVNAEMSKHGGYPVSNPYHRLSAFSDQKKNSDIYIQAFEKWLPQIVNTLRVLRVTGGEPLLSKSFWSLIGQLKESMNPHLELIVNSHLNHNLEILNKMYSEVSQLLLNKKIKSFQLYVSIDTAGAQAEYIRHGLNYQKVLGNIEHAMSTIPNIDIVVMCTFNILSIGNFKNFLTDVVELKKKGRVVIDISYLKNPEYLRADIATDDLIERIDDGIEYMKREKEHFSAHEIQKLENIKIWVQSEKNERKLKTRRSDFFRFINEYDRRKNKKFVDIFPEYKNFYIETKKTAFLMSEETE